MTLVCSVILCLFFKAGSSQFPCVKETLNEKEFSIDVTSHIQTKSGECFGIPYELTLPTNKDIVPFQMYLFNGDPHNIIDITNIYSTVFGTKDFFQMRGLPHGEHEFGFKLEWGCNQMFIFPKRVRISVSELTTRPHIRAFPMTEGQSARLHCVSNPLCGPRPKLHWEWTKADEQSTVLRGDEVYFPTDGDVFDTLKLTPSADDHNKYITCVADYGHSVVKTTVTLTVEFLPKIQNGSQCMVEGKLVVCVCISRGNPLPLITWSWASLTNFSVTRYSSIQTVHGTITMLAADYTNTKCVSSNELGRAEIELPLQNYTENYWLGMNPKSDAVLPWIIAGVSLSLNLVLLTTLIIRTYKRSKSQQRKPSVEINTYASLNQADVGQEYSVISPHPRGVSRE